jgi:signal transduction histidine kinase/ligand-binding sensor domain-containing protein
MRGWGIDQGLPQSSVRALAIERTGFVWGATSGGVFRFDGGEVRSLTVEDLPSFRVNRATALAAGVEGGVWVGTEDGRIFKIERGRERVSLPPIEGFPLEVDGIHEDPDGRVWALIQRGLWRWDPERARWDAIGEFWRSIHVRPFFQDPVEGLLLAGTRGGGRVVDDQIVPFPDPGTGLPDEESVTQHFRDPDGLLWRAAQSGLWVQRADQRWMRIPGVDEPIVGLAHCVISGLWALGRENAYRLDLPRRTMASDGSFERADLEIVPLPYPQAQSIVVTRDGVIVVGFAMNGFVTITPRTLRSLADLGPDELRFPHSILSDGRGGLWISRDGQGVIHLSEEALDRSGDRPLEARQWRQLPVRGARSLARDGAGNLWVGGVGLLARISPDGGVAQVSQDLVARASPRGGDPALRFPRALLAAGRDSLIVGYNDGVLLLVTEGGASVEPYPLWPQESVGDITTLARGPDGTLWVGSIGEVYRKVGAGFRALTYADGVPPGPVRALHPVEGGVWVGSYGGGARFLRRDRDVVPIPLEDGSVSGFLMGKNGSLWIFQNSGLVELSPTTVRRLEEMEPGPIDLRRFRSWDGIPEANNGSPAGAALPDGRLVLGTLGGVVVFDPTLLTPTATSPAVELVEVRTPLRRLRFPEGPLRLSRDERAIELVYSTATYRLSDPLRSRYRLNGTGPWNELGTRRTLQLAALPPGVHTVQFEVRLPDGNWRGLPDVVLDVEGRLFERGWFQALLVALVFILGVISLAHTIRIQRLRAYRFQSALEVEKAQRDREAVHREQLARVSRLALAGEMAAAMAHEVSQPVAALAQDGAVAKMLLSQKDLPPERIRPVVEAMIAQAERARGVIQGLRRFLLQEAPPVNETFDVRELLSSVEGLVRSELRNQGIRLEVTVEPGTPDGVGDWGMIQQVLMNLITNGAEAVHDVPWDRRILQIRARGVAGGLRISVADQGRGIRPEDRPSVFQPFFTTRPGGMGIGLPVARRVVLAHAGTIRVRSTWGNGSVFTITLPSSDGMRTRTPNDDRG